MTRVIFRTVTSTGETLAFFPDKELMSGKIEYYSPISESVKEATFHFYFSETEDAKQEDIEKLLPEVKDLVHDMHVINRLPH